MRMRLGIVILLIAQATAGCGSSTIPASMVAPTVVAAHLSLLSCRTSARSAVRPR